MPIDNETQSLKKEQNKKKTFIAVWAAVTAALLIGGFALYSYLTPVIEFAVGKPSDPNAESFAQTVMVAYGAKPGLPVPPHIQENLNEFGRVNSAALTELRENYTTPMRIEASVEVAGNQTIVTYSGVATDKNGDTVPYEKVLTFDFILTRETP